MAFSGISYLAIVAAAVASFIFGAVWYMANGKAWMAAAGITKQAAKPAATPFVISFLGELLMAWMLAGLIGHVSANVTVAGSVITAAFVWAGFVATTLTINHRYQMLPWSLTLIDGAHWLGVLLIQGLVIGLIGL